MAFQVIESLVLEVWIYAGHLITGDPVTKKPRFLEGKTIRRLIKNSQQVILIVPC